MNYISIIPETITDGEGIRTSIYVSGCRHYCPKCHNPQTWNFNTGKPLTTEIIKAIIEHIKKNPLQNGVTFTGGDPLEIGNAEDLLPFLKMFKEANINVWCYTGYVYEDLIKMNPQKECLKYINCLVDGPFIFKLKTAEKNFVGSSNQRVLVLN